MLKIIRWGMMPVWFEQNLARMTTRTYIILISKTIINDITT